MPGKPSWIIAATNLLVSSASIAVFRVYTALGQKGIQILNDAAVDFKLFQHNAFPYGFGLRTPILTKSAPAYYIMPPDPYHGQKGRLKMYPWFKLLHLFFIISWFAGLFYLPRIYVNLAQVEDTGSAEYRRLLEMSQRLMRFMTPLGIGAALFGILIPFATGWWVYGWCTSNSRSASSSSPTTPTAPACCTTSPPAATAAATNGTASSTKYPS